MNINLHVFLLQEALKNSLKDIKPQKITNQPTGNSHLKMSHKRGPHNAACNENKNQLVLNFMLTKKGFVDFARNPKHKFHVGLCYIYHLSFHGIENQNVFLRFISSVGLDIILNWVFDIIKKQFNFEIWQCPIYTKYCFFK